MDGGIDLRRSYRPTAAGITPADLPHRSFRTSKAPDGAENAKLRTCVAFSMTWTVDTNLSGRIPTRMRG
jgi:hypothetical protein